LKQFGYTHYRGNIYKHSGLGHEVELHDKGGFTHKTDDLDTSGHFPHQLQNTLQKYEKKK